MELRITGRERTYILNCIKPMREASPKNLQETAENINKCITGYMKGGWFGSFATSLIRFNHLEHKYRADPSYK